MADSLLSAYLPLLAWTGLGFFLFRFLPDTLPRLLGRLLYWVGIPLEIFALARQTSFGDRVGLVPVITILALLGGLALARVALQGVIWSRSSEAETTDSPLVNLWENRARQGSFLISSMIGNTGFVGLAIAPTFVSSENLSWLIFYSVTHNVVGTYGIGVFLASYFGRSNSTNHWWVQLRDVLTVPSLWAFTIGAATQTIELPLAIESGLKASVWFIIPTALLLMGMRVSQLQGWKSLRLAIVPSLLKVLIIPASVGLATTLLGLTGEPRLALVLMSGMPTAFAGLILAEEYELDRELISSSIVLSTGLLLIAIPLWLLLFQ